MNEKKVIVSSQHGFHTRPAAQFVKQAKAFASNITVRYQGKEASAKSLFKLQTLGIVEGAEINLIAEGEDSNQALEVLAGLLAELK